MFDVTVPNISYHFKKIFKSGELDAGTVVKDFLITAQSGARGTKFRIEAPDGEAARGVLPETPVGAPLSRCVDAVTVVDEDLHSRSCA